MKKALLKPRRDAAAQLNDIEAIYALLERRYVMKMTTEIHVNGIIITNDKLILIMVLAHKLLNTGDILLFRGDSNDKWYDTLIEDITNSPYEHAAMVLKDPDFCAHDFCASGLYVIETDGSTGHTHVVTLDDMLIGRRWVDVRCWQDVSYNNEFQTKLLDFYEEVEHKPYDYCPCDWLKAGLWSMGCRCIGKVKRHDKNFWCSALVACAATKIGLLPENTDWSNMTPADLAKLKVETPNVLGDLERLK